jgi:putative Holliday junction resolvase
MITGRLLGIDHGLKRIGLAVSDASGLVARELSIIQRQSKVADFATINRVAADHGVVAMVVGIPGNDVANPGGYTQADTVRRWIERLADTTNLPIIQWDEQLSSVDAQALARTQRRKPQEPIDDLAARVILQSYLDAVRDGLATPPPRSTI